MRSKITFFSALACLALNAPQMMAQQNNLRLAKANVIGYSKITNLPNFINVEGQQLKEENFINWAVYSLNVPGTSTFKPYSVEKDELGYTHTRHKQYINNIPVEGSMLISHSLGAEVKTVNGDYYQNFSANTSASLSEANALQFALQKVNAKKYMWENDMFTNQKRLVANDNNFTFYP